MATLERDFIDRSRSYLTTDYLAKIRIALENLSDEDLWWKPNSSSNSVGNLLLHLSGNLRQWVVSGLGGEADVRRREFEFEPEHRPERAELVRLITTAVADADRVIGELDPAQLQVPRAVQGREVTGFEALYHAVEHFAMHTGQILYIIKMRSDQDLAFYEIVEGIPRERWSGRRIQD